MLGSLADDCPELPPAVDDSPSALVDNHIATARMYQDCKSSKHNLVEHVKSSKGVDVQ